MATRIHITRDGAPLVGAKVLVGTLVGTRLTTNADGKISFDLTPPDWQGWAELFIEDAEGLSATSTLHIKEGKDHTVALGS